MILSNQIHNFTSLRTIGVDADDTLWYDHIYFKDLRESLFCLFEKENIKLDLAKNVLKQNFSNIGVGENEFANAIFITAKELQLSTSSLYQLGTYIENFLHHPIKTLKNVSSVLDSLVKNNFDLVLISKGILSEQIKKLNESGLKHYFRDTFIVRQKDEIIYKEIILKLNLNIHEFIFIGNNIREDIIPFNNLGMNTIWLNHESNFLGRNNILPVNSISVNSWDDVYSILIT